MSEVEKEQKRHMGKGQRRDEGELMSAGIKQGKQEEK